MTTATRILVLGGTGFVGRVVCEKLVERGGGTLVTVPSRHANRHLHGALGVLPGVEIEQADIHDDAQLASWLKGQHVVINLVAILHGSEAEFDRAHVQLPKRLARLAAEAGVERIVHVSALGADANGPSRYLRSKGRGEEALRAGTVPVTILRPSVIFGAEDRFINLFAAMQSVAPAVPLAGADAKFQPVWVEDVADAIVKSIDDPSMAGVTIECCGPEVFTLRELVQKAGEWAGHRRMVIPLPGPVARLQALTMEWLPGETLMSRDNLDSMRVANVASGSRPGLERLHIAPRAIESVMGPWLASHGREKHFETLRAIARGR